MASCFCKGRSVFFVFKNGVSQLDCQNRPRMYKSIEQFKGKFPNYGHEDVELVEYAPVVRCKDCKYRTWFAPGYGCGNYESPFYAAVNEDVPILTKPDDSCSYEKRRENNG